QRDRLAPETPSQLLGAIGRSVRDERDRGAARDEVADGLLADLPRADDEDGSSAQVAEDLLREHSGGGGDRSGTLGDRRLGARLAPGVESFAEETVEDRPRRAAVARGADLTEDLSLPWHHRIETGGHAEEVQRSRLVAE